MALLEIGFFIDIVIRELLRELISTSALGMC